MYSFISLDLLRRCCWHERSLLMKYIQIRAAPIICFVWWFLYNYTLLHIVVRKAHLSPHVCLMSLLCPSIWITLLFLPFCLVLTSLWFLVSWYTLLCFFGQNDEVSKRAAGLKVQGWGQISITGPFRVASCGNCSWSAYSFVPWMQ